MGKDNGEIISGKKENGRMARKDQEQQHHGHLEEVVNRLLQVIKLLEINHVGKLQQDVLQEKDLMLLVVNHHVGIPLQDALQEKENHHKTVKPQVDPLQITEKQQADPLQITEKQLVDHHHVKILPLDALQAKDLMELVVNHHVGILLQVVLQEKE